MLHYRKTSKRPEPVLQPPPMVEELLRISDAGLVKDTRMLEMVYNIARSGTLNDDCDIDIPPWPQYHAKLSDSAALQVSTVAFNPILMASPSDPDMIYTTLIHFKEVASSLGHSCIPVCFDMGILTKVLEILWSNPNDLAGVIPTETGMHFFMSVFSGIGFL